MRVPPVAMQAAHQLYRLRWWLMRPITTGVRVLAVDGEKVLLVRHTYQPGWHMPGGGLKRNETLEEAARRELLEETGLTVERLELAGIFTNLQGSKTDHIILFRAVARGTPCGSSPEVAECCWFPVAALPEDCARGTQHRISDLAVPGAPVAVGRW